MQKIVFSSLVLMTILASCSPSLVSTPTVTLIASPTIVPTSTKTPTPSVTLPPTISATSTATPESFTMASQTSPDGEYTAFSYFYYGTEQQTVEIKDNQGKLVWQILYQGELPRGYDPRTTIGIYRWSNDSSQLYFCYYWSPDGGDIFIRESCGKLQKIDIRTGEIQPVIPEGYRAFEISPDGSQIAYLRCQDESCIIHIQNLSTGVEKVKSVIDNAKDYVAIGGISWSPNSNGLVFRTQDIDYIMVQTIYLNISTMKHKVIRKYPIPDFPGWGAFTGWADNDILEFIESGDTGLQVIQVNIGNDETIVIGTPTPRY